MDANKYQLMQTIAAIVSAVSGILMVFIGILFKRYLDKRQKPKLVMLHDATIGGDIKYLPPEFTHDNSEEVWIKVRVKNISPAYAEDVELRLYSIKRENDASVSRHTAWFKVSSMNAISTSIPSEFQQYFDIAYVKKIVNKSDDLGFYLVLAANPMQDWSKEKEKIETSRHTKLFIGGEYTLLISLSCRNGGTKHYKIRMNVLGAGNDDLVAEGLLGLQNFNRRIVFNFLGEVNPNLES